MPDAAEAIENTISSLFFKHIQLPDKVFSHQENPFLLA
jgi:hypothetical protein